MSADREEGKEEAPPLSLRDWIAGLLRQRPGGMRRRYVYEHRASEELAHLNQWPAPREITEDAWRELHLVPDATLEALHRHLRGRAAEDAIWDEVIRWLWRPLPVPVAHDLLDRRIATGILKHRRQEDEIQWRMARELGGEALLTLALDYYERSERPREGFEAILREFADDAWMLKALEHGRASSLEKEAAYRAAAERPDAPDEFRRYLQWHRLKQAYRDPDVEPEVFRARLAPFTDNEGILERLLAQGDPSSAEKQAIYRDVVRQRPRSAEFLRLYNTRQALPRYTRRCYTGDDLRALLREFLGDEPVLRALHDARPGHPEKEEVYLETLMARPRSGELQRILELHLQWRRAADPTLAEDEIRALYATGEPRTLEALAANPMTPEALLREMAEMRESRGARGIRQKALAALRHYEHMARREEVARRRAEHRRRGDG